MRLALAAIVALTGCSRTVHDAVWTLELEREGKAHESTVTVRGLTCDDARDDPGRLLAIRLQTKRRSCKKDCGWSEGDPSASATCRVECDASTKVASERCRDATRTVSTPWMRLH